MQVMRRGGSNSALILATLQNGFLIDGRWFVLVADLAGEEAG